MSSTAKRLDVLEAKREQLRAKVETAAHEYGRKFVRDAGLEDAYWKEKALVENVSAETMKGYTWTPEQWPASFAYEEGLIRYLSSTKTGPVLLGDAWADSLVEDDEAIRSFAMSLTVLMACVSCCPEVREARELSAELEDLRVTP